MRCCCCDWSPDMPSVFQTSLPETPTHLLKSRVDNEYYCNICLDTVVDALQGFELPEEKGWFT